MIHTNNPIIKHQAGFLNLAKELGNGSKACKVMGVSRDTFYRSQELIKEGGLDSLINKSRRAPNPKHRVDEATEQAVNCVNQVSLFQAAESARSGCVMTWSTSKSG